jgi:hypothetical protein
MNSAKRDTVSDTKVIIEALKYWDSVFEQPPLTWSGGKATQVPTLQDRLLYPITIIIGYSDL